MGDDLLPFVDDVDPPFLLEQTTAVQGEHGSRPGKHAIDLFDRRERAVVFGCVLAVAVIAGFVVLEQVDDQASLPAISGLDPQPGGRATAPISSVEVDDAITDGGQRSPSVPDLPVRTSAPVPGRTQPEAPTSTVSVVVGPMPTSSTDQPATESESSVADVPTLGAITDQIAASPDAFGEKGPDLLKLLQEVQRESGEKRIERAEKTLEEIAKWSQEDKLDSAIAEIATLRLKQITAG